MKYLALLLTIFLLGCDFDTPLPDRCTELGVNVPHGSAVTGKIISEHMADLDTVRVRCQDSLTQEKYGCTIAVNVREYVLWYVDDSNVRDHERCHALYEAQH